MHAICQSNTPAATCCQVSSSDSHTDNVNSISSITYRELTKREGDAYRDTLHRMRTEESITKTKEDSNKK
jgi:hypothetical protein